MSEFTAVCLTMACAVIATLVVIGVLFAVHANGGFMVIAFVVIFWIGADAAVRVERRYDRRSQR